MIRSRIRVRVVIRARIRVRVVLKVWVVVTTSER